MHKTGKQMQSRLQLFKASQILFWQAKAEAMHEDLSLLMFINYQQMEKLLKICPKTNKKMFHVGAVT